MGEGSRLHIANSKLVKCCSSEQRLVCWKNTWRPKGEAASLLSSIRGEGRRRGTSWEDWRSQADRLKELGGGRAGAGRVEGKKLTW